MRNIIKFELKIIRYVHDLVFNIKEFFFNVKVPKLEI